MQEFTEENKKDMILRQRCALFKQVIHVRCSIEVLDLAIKDGASVDYFDKNVTKIDIFSRYVTPLGLAVRDGDFEIIKFLLKKGAGIGKNMEEALAIEELLKSSTYLKNLRLSILLLSSKMCKRPRIKVLPTELIREIMERFDIGLVKDVNGKIML
jgi:hypothetical protein